jgi:hypothetical protein
LPGKAGEPTDKKLVDGGGEEEASVEGMTTRLNKLFVDLTPALQSVTMRTAMTGGACLKTAKNRSKSARDAQSQRKLSTSSVSLTAP